jgi:hypothetical protein
MDNFKIGFGNKFGGQLGQGSGLGLGAGSASTGGFAAGGGAAAAIQPQNATSASTNNLKLGLGGLGGPAGVETNLDNSMRKSNVLSTPSSKGKFDNDNDEFENN